MRIGVRCEGFPFEKKLDGEENGGYSFAICVEDTTLYSQSQVVWG